MEIKSAIEDGERLLSPAIVHSVFALELARELRHVAGEVKQRFTPPAKARVAVHG
jgi:hypothetical protein